MKIALRNLLKNKVYSFINIIGLSIGMAVAILIGLWIHDETTYNHYHKNYPHIAQVFQHQSSNEASYTFGAMPRPLEMAIRNQYGDDIEYFSMSSWNSEHILNYKNKTFNKEGNFFQSDFPKMLNLNMVYGSTGGLQDSKSILLSRSTSEALFGNIDPVGKIIKLNNQASMTVQGVYEDLPQNTTFQSLEFMAHWDWYLSTNVWARNAIDQWNNSSFQMYLQLKPHATMEGFSDKIKDLKLEGDTSLARYNPQVFLFPMDEWHLYDEFKDRAQVGGAITYVWLFGIIGAFVLLLACINFTNLSTARSEKKAKEVGVRKVIGSLKSQLIGQFLSESLMTTLLALFLSLLLVQLVLPSFNLIADKDISLPWTNPFFYAICLAFTVLTGVLAGLYPALYLSSFQPVKVLKGSFRSGKRAALPRKVLVVVQFTVSVTLIIGTITVYRQIQFVKNRPVGYEREGLVMVQQNSRDFLGKLDVLKQELTKEGAITHISESSSPITGLWSNINGFTWPDKDPNLEGEFGITWVSHDFGKTVDWKIKEGRDFSREFATDSNAIILNEAAVKFIGLEDPVGMTITSGDGEEFKVIGTIQDIIQQSPNRPVRQTLYFLSSPESSSYFNLRLNPEKSARESLATIESVFNTIIPAAPFQYEFVDDVYAEKFENEERIGTLAGVFTVLAILISCLGLFGLASYMAEKRMKEIGIRKVLGASVVQLWQLLSYDFLVLVLISSGIAIPIAYYFLNGWLENYEIHTEVSLLVFLMAGAGAVIITLITVSYQALKAATLNPVEVLKDE